MAVQQDKSAQTMQEQEWQRITRQQLRFVEGKMTDLLKNVSELIPEPSDMTPLAVMLPEERRRFEALRRMQKQLLARL